MTDPEITALISKLRYTSEEIGRYNSLAGMAENTRKTLLEQFFEDAKQPGELMGKARILAENMKLPVSIILRWLGTETVTTGDTIIYNSKHEKIGVLYLADIFEVGSTGAWQSIEEDKVIWYMAGEYDITISTTTGERDAQAARTGSEEIRSSEDQGRDSAGAAEGTEPPAGDS